MDKRYKVLIALGVTLFILIIGFSVFFNATPTGKRLWNDWFHSVQKADDETNYETRKLVEDTARAMIASYNADKLVYQQYKDSENTEERSWANQAKMRANQTASTYNNYILQNNYVWKDNIPSDISAQLAYIE